MNRSIIALTLVAILSGCSGSEEETDTTPKENPDTGDSRPIPSATLDRINALREPENGISTNNATIKLSNTYNEAVTVNYKIEPASADERDFQVNTEGSVEIPPNTSTGTFEINIYGDDFDEEEETFRVSLSEGSNVKVDDQFQDVSIVDSDPTPVVRFKDNDNEFTLIAEGSGELDIVLEIDTLSQRKITVPFSFSGIAAATQDYELIKVFEEVNGTFQVTFEEESPQTILSLNLLSDDVPEGGESLIIDLETPQNGTIDQDESTYRILIPGDAVLNDTGVNQYYTDTGYSESPDSNYPAQDAFYGKDAANPSSTDGHASFSFTKLDKDGNALPSNESNYRCVLDNNTGLVWEVKSSPQTLPTQTGRPLRDHLNELVNQTDEDGNSLYPYNDAHYYYNASNYQYYYFNQDNNTNGGSPGTAGPNFWLSRYPIDNNCAYPNDNMVNHLGGDAKQCNTKVHAEAFNSLAICGFKDWTVPTIEQLRSLHSYQENTENANYFLNAQVGTYLSSSPSADGTGAVWCLDTDDGAVKLCNKQFTNYLRLVRGGIEF